MNSVIAKEVEEMNADGWWDRVYDKIMDPKYRFRNKGKCIPLDVVIKLKRKKTKLELAIVMAAGVLYEHSKKEVEELLVITV